MQQRDSLGYHPRRRSSAVRGLLACGEYRGGIAAWKTGGQRQAGPAEKYPRCHRVGDW